MEGRHQPLASREDFALAQKMQKVRTCGTTDHPHLLTGIAYCADCGSPLYAKKRGQYWYLNCYGYYRDPVAHRCTSHSIREDRVVRAVEDALHALAQNQVDIQGVIQKCARKQHHAQDVQGQRRKLEQQLENARRARLDAYKDKAAGILQAEEFDYISRSLRQEEARCRQELDRLARQEENRSQLCILEQKTRVFLQFDHLEKSQLQQLVRRVEVDDRKQIHIFFNFAAPRKEGDCPPFLNRGNRLFLWPSLGGVRPKWNIPHNSRGFIPAKNRKVRALGAKNVGITIGMKSCADKYVKRKENILLRMTKLDDAGCPAKAIC